MDQQNGIFSADDDDDDGYYVWAAAYGLVHAEFAGFLGQFINEQLDIDGWTSSEHIEGTAELVHVHYDTGPWP